MADEEREAPAAVSNRLAAFMQRIGQRLSTAAARPAPESHGEEPPPTAARSRWSRCRASAEHLVARRWQHFT
jgi:hypothetical protein